MYRREYMWAAGIPWCAVWTVLYYRLGQCKIHEVLLVQGQPSCRTHSLVPRPFEEGDEKGPGTHGQRMRQNLPESIRILCHCINKPCGARIITKIVQEYLAVSVMYDGLRTEVSKANTITQISGDWQLRMRNQYVPHCLCVALPKSVTFQLHSAFLGYFSMHGRI